MGVSKVVYGDDTIVDLTGDSVAAEKMLSGTTAHDKAGNPITGTIPTVVQATPKIYVAGNGQITASATQTEGYVSAGTKTATKNLTVIPAQTIVPSTAEYTIAPGVYLTGAQTIKGDANLVPENIASGVSIFGVEGTLEAGGGGASVETCTVTLTGEVEAGFDHVKGYFLENGEVVFVDDKNDTTAFDSVVVGSLFLVCTKQGKLVGDYYADILHEYGAFHGSLGGQTGMNFCAYKIMGDTTIAISEN